MNSSLTLLSLSSQLTTARLAFSQVPNSHRQLHVLRRRSRILHRRRESPRSALTLSNLLAPRSPLFASPRPFLSKMDMEDVAADLNVSLDVVHLTVAVFVFGQLCLF